MFSLQSLRIARSTRFLLPVRTFVTTPETPPNQKQNNSDTALLAAAAAAAGAAGVYWYLNQPQGLNAKREGDEISRKAGELADISKARAEDLLKHSQQQYSDIKASGQDKLAAARARADGAASGAQATYDAYRPSAQQSLSDARSSYADGRDAKEAQTGWFTRWLGWGSSNADQVKKGGSKKVADAADGVKKAG